MASSADNGIPAVLLQKYKLMSKKGEGTFAEVLKAQSLRGGDLVAIKKLKNKFENVDQVNSLREIQALRRLSPHPQVIKLNEFIFDKSYGKLFLVFELMDMNLYELIKGRKQFLPEKKVASIMHQIMKGIDHMHRNGIFHRDIKPENILIKEDKVKLADFGSCRGIYSKQPYTEYISTRWYRAPECLLTDGYYTYKMDIWGIGCVFFEISCMYPLFPGANELDQIQLIHNVFGTPNMEVLSKITKASSAMSYNFPQKEGSGLLKLVPHASPDCFDLMTKMLIYDPDERITARHCLRHPYFKDYRDTDNYKPHTSSSPSPQPGHNENDLNLTANQSKISKGPKKMLEETSEKFPVIDGLRTEGEALGIKGANSLITNLPVFAGEDKEAFPTLVKVKAFDSSQDDGDTIGTLNRKLPPIGDLPTSNAFPQTLATSFNPSGSFGQSIGNSQKSDATVPNIHSPFLLPQLSINAPPLNSSLVPSIPPIPPIPSNNPSPTFNSHPNGNQSPVPPAQHSTFTNQTQTQTQTKLKPKVKPRKKINARDSSVVDAAYN